VKGSVLTGLECFIEQVWKRFKGLKLGLLCNQASVDRKLRPSKYVLHSLLGPQLEALFTPQHGYGAEEQDNMNETPHGFDSRLGIPIYSLYSETREPTRQMLEQIDTLLVDLQDVGCRVYTFGSTLLNCLKAASDYQKKVIVLDRPNPLGGATVEGNLLKKELFSFVGPWELPMRHGLTLGEMALMFKGVYKLDCELEVITMKGWNRDMLWEDTSLPWVMPSPNMPFNHTAYVYPGQVIWEGTNLSEGRGTCRPFEVFGAPFLDCEAISKDMGKLDIPGCLTMEFHFTPTFNKWQGKRCNGFFICVTNPRAFRPFRTTLLFLKAVIKHHAKEFSWKEPPYEYVFDKRPIDLIIGDERIVRWIEEGAEVKEIEEVWQDDLKDYLEFRENFLLYR